MKDFLLDASSVDKHSGQEIFLIITKKDFINIDKAWFYCIAGIECCGIRTEKLPTNKWNLITPLIVGPECQGIFTKRVIWIIQSNDCYDVLIKCEKD